MAAYRCTTPGCNFRTKFPSIAHLHEDNYGHKTAATYESGVTEKAERELLTKSEAEKARDVKARAQEHGETGQRTERSTYQKDTMELKAKEPRPERPRNLLVEEMHAKAMGDEPSRERTNQHLIFGRGLGFKKVDRFNRGSRN